MVAAVGTGTATQGASAGDVPFTGPGASSPRSAVSPNNFAAEWIAQTVALRPAQQVAAFLTWTPTPSSWATGYRLERSAGGTVQSTRSVISAGASAATETRPW